MSCCADSSGRRRKGPSFRVSAAAALLAGTVLVTAGCGTLVAGIRIVPPKERTEQQGRRRAAELGPFRNNTTYRVGAGVYVGDLVIHANKVVLAGAGADSTVFADDVVINGNSCTLRGLAVRGDVTINGNNNDIRGVRVLGRVRINGNNNLR